MISHKKMRNKKDRLFLSAVLMMLCFAAIAQTNSSSEETELLRLTNVLRTNPRLFLQKHARPFLIENDEDTVTNKYVSSLISELQSLPSTGALSLDPELNNLARAFAK